MSARQLLESIVADLGNLADNYARAGFLEETTAQKSVRSLIGEREEILAFRRVFLFTDGLLRNVIGRRICAGPRPLRHVAVFGGTNVGKSTCANVILGFTAAEVHHRGGFTRHAHAYLPPDTPTSEIFGGNPFTFRRFTCVAPDQLDRNVFDRYALHELAPLPAVPDLVVWDTPDCDAVDSGLYMPAVIETVTLADVVVYVTSKEKYAVDSILEWAIMLAEAGTPLVGCLNLTPLREQRDVIDDQKNSLATVAARHEREAPDLPVVALQFVEDPTLLYDPAYEPARRLREQVMLRAEQAVDNRPSLALAFVKKHLATILEPARAEIEAIEQWQSALNGGLERFQDDYRRGYLDNPKRYDAFGRVSVRILELLDPPIPGLKTAIKAVRMVLSLPAQVVLFVSKKLWKLAFATGDDGRKDVPPEVQTYLDANTALINGLAKLIKLNCSKPRHHPFWDDLDAQWDSELDTLQKGFQKQLDEHWRQTDWRINRTADAIYAELEKLPPMQLNALRAGRLAGDAAAIIIAAHTGPAGKYIYDIVLAPALMSLLEGISRLITATYVQSKQVELRAALLEGNRKFVEEVYRPPLAKLSESALEHSGFLKIEPEVIRTLPERIDTLDLMFVNIPAAAEG